MGAYLSAPVTHKEFFEGSSPDVIYGGASMQVISYNGRASLFTSLL